MRIIFSRFLSSSVANDVKVASKLNELNRQRKANDDQRPADANESISECKRVFFSTSFCFPIIGNPILTNRRALKAHSNIEAYNFLKLLVAVQKKCSLNAKKSEIQFYGERESFLWQ